ncbi:hypothetical protein BDW66DRAFT_147016 [Aspergillus desertorum]
MATTTTQHPLTKRNLAILDRLLQNKHASEKVTSWAEKVISEEQMQLFCTKPPTTLDGMQLPTGDKVIDPNIECDMAIFAQPARSHRTADTTRTDVDSSQLIKVQTPRPFMCLESPLERYLTPGSSEPNHFSRLALAHVELRYGDMEGKRERAEIARGHVEVVRDNALQAREQAGK